MHVRGKDVVVHTASIRTAEQEVLLRVPKYDFNWQIRTSWPSRS